MFIQLCLNFHNWKNLSVNLTLFVGWVLLLQPPPIHVVILCKQNPGSRGWWTLFACLVLLKLAVHLYGKKCIGLYIPQPQRVCDCLPTVHTSRLVQAVVCALHTGPARGHIANSMVLKNRDIGLKISKNYPIFM